MPKKTYRRSNLRRLLNGLAALTTRLGLGSRTGILVTRGHKSGLERATPVDLIHLDGSIHVVGIYGTSAWVRNLRAEPRCRVQTGRRVTSYLARELVAADGARVLRAYLESSALVRDYQDVGPDDPEADFEAAAADRPAFRLEPDREG